MQERLLTFAGEYDANADRQAYEQDGQRSLHHPLVYMFIGDKSLEALEAVYWINETKWNNSKGVVYLHVYTEKTTSRNNLFSFKLPVPSEELDRKSVRKQLHRSFYEESLKLVELNRTVRQISNRIAEFGKVYTSFQQLDIAVVTRADDPSNVLVPEFSHLLREVLSGSFKQIQTDLYTLLQEKDEEGNFPYASSLSYSFLRDLDCYQNTDYSFEADLQTVEDNISMPVSYGPAPLFDLVYLLSDKNEQGIFIYGSMETNYEIICTLCLLKNRKIVDEHDRKHENYNNQDYKRQISPTDVSGNVYSSAGFSKVKRPNQAIVLTVIQHVYQIIVRKLREQGVMADRRTILELWSTDSGSINRNMELLVPGKDQLEEMNALLSSAVNFNDLRKMTLAQAEEMIYGQHAQEFFQNHFVSKAEQEFESLELERELMEAMNHKIIANPRFGLICAYDWTSEQENAIIYQELRNLIKETSKQIDGNRLKLEQLLQETVDMQPFTRIPFMGKSNVKKFCRYFFETVYGKRLEAVFLETRLSLLRRLEGAFAKLHEDLKPAYQRLLELDRHLSEASRLSVSQANDYLGRNISEYYATVVAGIMKELQSKRGELFLLEERFVGNMASHLEAGTEHLLIRLIDVCKRDIFPNGLFRQSFEDELLQRANVTVRFDEGQNVLSKEELYRDLYDTLQDGATIHIDVYNFTQKHRHAEHYFFGDLYSEFIRYAFDADKGTRTYKLGCVHEKKNSGIEKLHIMGGFQMDDVMYYRNGKRYYDSYVANGFEFHPTEPKN